MAEQAIEFLSAPILRLGAADVPIPQHEDLERFVFSQVADIEQAVMAVMTAEQAR